MKVLLLFWAWTIKDDSIYALAFPPDGKDEWLLQLDSTAILPVGAEVSIGGGLVHLIVVKHHFDPEENKLHLQVELNEAYDQQMSPTEFVQHMEENWIGS